MLGDISTLLLSYVAKPTAESMCSGCELEVLAQLVDWEKEAAWRHGAVSGTRPSNSDILSYALEFTPNVWALWTVF